MTTEPSDKPKIWETVLDISLCIIYALGLVAMIAILVPVFLPFTIYELFVDEISSEGNSYDKSRRL